jgi:hypothetical protein
MKTALFRAALGALACLALYGCDAQPIELSDADPEQGPSRALFEQNRLLSGEQADLLVAEQASSFGKTDERSVMVPLVFDETGHLYSPRRFNEIQRTRSREERNGSDKFADELSVSFTDLKSFNQAVGRRYAALYAGARRGRIGGVEVLDPYALTPEQIAEIERDSPEAAQSSSVNGIPDCPPTALDCVGDGGGGDPTAGDPDRPTSDGLRPMLLRLAGRCCGAAT